MGWVNVGVAAASVVGGWLSADSAQDAQEEAQRQQLQWEQRKLQIAQENRADDIDRGFAGFEDELRGDFGEMRSNFRTLRRGGAGGRAVRRVADRLEPSVDRGISVINDDIFGDGFRQRQLASQTAVNVANTARAEAIAAGHSQAAADAIATAKAEDAMKGFFGGSTASRNEVLREKIRGNVEVAKARGDAELQNQQGLKEVDDTDIMRLRNSLDLPFQFTQNFAQQELAPFLTDSQIMQAQLAPLSSFRINAPAANLGNVDFKPIVDSGQAAIGAGFDAVAGGLSAYQRNQDLQAQRQHEIDLANINAGNT